MANRPEYEYVMLNVRGEEVTLRLELRSRK